MSLCSSSSRHPLPQRCTVYLDKIVRVGLRGREGGVCSVIATNSVLVSQPFFLEVWESVKRGRRKVSYKGRWRENGRERAF